MGTGYLKVQTRTADGALAVGDARVMLFDEDGNLLYQAFTDANGDTQALPLPAPDVSLTLDPDYGKPAYSTWTVVVEKDGFADSRIVGVGIVDTSTAVLPVNMTPLPRGTLRQNAPEQEFDLPPLGLLANDTNQTGGESTNSRVLADVVIPDYITVHLGAPTNSAARNVRVRFIDYIKNVVSSEIYSTWPEDAIIANVHVVVTFALNRIYTEWYRARGYNFDITSSTAYDQSYRDGGPIYENISRIVDEIFNVYAHRSGFKNPYFTSFCNGTTVTCAGLSQWGTVDLAKAGFKPLQILRHYYGSDIELTASDNYSSITESYPGYALGLGSSGADVRKMQNFLNRIRANFPLIPPINNPNGVFGEDTAEAVKAFQRTFNLTPDGVIGRATWNQISYIYASVARLAELDSEGERIGIGQIPPNITISQGARGQRVLELQFILNAIAPYYPSIPNVIQDNLFSADLKNAVIAFQRQFGLTPDGVVGPVTWQMLYKIYHTVHDTGQVPPISPPEGSPPAYPGSPLREGSRGDDVRLMQNYLNAIRTVYPSIPKLDVDGIFGPLTRQAVVAFQNQFLLNPDGVIGPITWDYIVEQYLLLSGGGSWMDYPGTPLRVGSRGSAVSHIQQMLTTLSDSYPSIPALVADGIFGEQTLRAVNEFQRIFGLSVDGVVGPVTWAAITNSTR